MRNLLQNRLVIIWIIILYFIFIGTIYLSIIYLGNQNDLEVNDQPFNDSISIKKMKLVKGGFVVIKVFRPTKKTSIQFASQIINPYIPYLPPGIYTDLKVKLIPLGELGILNVTQGDSLLVKLYEDSDKDFKYNPNIDKELKNIWLKGISGKIYLK